MEALEAGIPRLSLLPCSMPEMGLLYGVQRSSGHLSGIHHGSAKDDRIYLEEKAEENGSLGHSSTSSPTKMPYSVSPFPPIIDFLLPALRIRLLTRHEFPLGAEQVIDAVTLVWYAVGAALDKRKLDLGRFGYTTSSQRSNGIYMILEVSSLSAFHFILHLLSLGCCQRTK